MGRKPHCKDCGIEIVNKDEAIKKGNVWLCLECNEKLEKRKDDRCDLYSYICELYQINQPTGLMMKQIKDYKEEFNYTYVGMLLSLKYFYELQGNSVKEDTGLGIIPFIYEQAKQHYISGMQVKKSLDSQAIDVKETIITLTNKKTNNNKQIIDITKL